MEKAAQISGRLHRHGGLASFQFLLQLEEQPMRRHSQLHGGFFNKGVQEWIAENEYGINTAFKWPSLTEIGKLAFRSQVVICLPLFPALIQVWQ